MKPKQILMNKSFCPLPWTGFIVQQNGDVKNCVLAKKTLGNLRERTVQEIMSGAENTEIKEQMLSDSKPSSCEGCHRLEQGKSNLDIISERLYYIKELRDVDPELYDQLSNFNLHTVDIRWTNQCNQACVYCGPHNSTLWEKEVGASEVMSLESKKALRDYIFQNVSQLKNVYLAGGEPTLMNENIAFLKLLLERNPKVHLRVNTNLSNIQTKVARLIMQFENVHWIVSVESTGDHYDYIRYGGSWQRLVDNISTVRLVPGHKVSFNMLYCILNHKEIFNCIDFLVSMGFHNNSFVVGPVIGPRWLNIRNLPAKKLEWCKSELQQRIEKKPGFLLEDGLRNLWSYLDEAFAPDLDESFRRLREIDQRRGLDSKKVIPELYD